MKTNTKTILLFIMSFALIGFISFTYAYFSSDIVNNNVKDQVVQTGTLSLRYVDGSEINMQNIKPGFSVTKTIYVANTGTLDTSYNLIWQELVNEITNDEMVIEATCTRMDATTETESGSCNSITTKPIKDENIRKNITIEPSVVHKYDITIIFKETNDPQNYNQGKKFSGVLGVSEFKLPSPVNCTFDGEMVQGAEYVNGRYTYRYKQQGGLNERLIEEWQDMSDDGWGVRVVGNGITDPIIDKMCTYINDKPVISMSYLFSGNQASSIDLSSFNTSNVTNMNGMFAGSAATTLDLSSFNTSNVIDMSYMFAGSAATVLDLSSFDTSNVTHMYRMFSGSEATTIDLSSFNTSNVTNMNGMFSGSAATTLDLSNFDTSNVTNMNYMFYGCTSLKTIYVGNKFNVDNVSDSSDMFNGTTNIEGSAGTKYSSSHIDKEYARIDGGTSSPGYFTLKNN